MFSKLPILIETSTEPIISLSDAFRFLRIYTSAEDIETHPEKDTVQLLLNAAISAAETVLNFDIRIRTWEYAGYDFETLLINKFPFRNIVFVKYTTPEGVEVGFETYEVVRLSNDTAKVIFNGEFPKLKDTSNAVRVQFETGFVVLPNDIQLAILLILSKYYDDRSNGKHSFPSAAENLLRPHRKRNF